jgi:hypothetical protein
MNNFIRLVLFVLVQACFQSSLCSDWKNSVVKLENNEVKNTIFKPQQGVRETEKNSKQFFRIPPNHVPANVHNINGELPHIQQEPIVPVISVQPSNVVPQVPFYQAHQENHFAQHTSEQLAVINPRPVIVAEPVIEPFPIQQPVVSATGEIIIEQTIGGILKCLYFFQKSTKPL